MSAADHLTVPARNAAFDARSPTFTICTLVTRWAEYIEMTESFVARGFGPEVAEYLYLDNSSRNEWDAYAGLAKMLGQARGRYVIYCHQDVRLLSDGAAELHARLVELGDLDADWALAGNAGGLPNGELAVRISDPHGENTTLGSLPARAVSLDENFFVLRRESPIGVSADIGGFHLYGADLCMQAQLAGRGAWVVDFHLRHLSGGRADQRFYDVQERLQEKYAGLFSRRWQIRTTCTTLIFPIRLRDRLRAWRFMRARRKHATKRFGQ
jgi:hypothetical protein